MSVGYEVDKPTLDRTVGSLVVQLRSTFEQVASLKAWLDARQDSELTTLGYTSDDVTLLRSSFTDLNNLQKIAHAQGTQSNANDFFFNAGRLTGLR